MKIISSYFSRFIFFFLTVVVVSSQDHSDPSEYGRRTLASNKIWTPPGCTCSTSSCQNFDCSCNCDLTADICDSNCCCDGDCSTEDKSQFSSTCTNDSVTPTSAFYGRMCYEDVTKINPKYPVTLDTTVQDGLNGLLCIQVDNSAVKGYYFDDPGYPASSVAFTPPFGQASLLKATDYNSYPNKQHKQDALSSFYRIGGAIPFVYKQEDNYFIMDVLRIPFGGSSIASDNAGVCQYLNAVEFRRNIGMQDGFKGSTNQYCGECTVPVAVDDEKDMSSRCQNEFNIDRYVKHGAVFLGTKPNVALSMTSTSSNASTKPDLKNFVMVDVNMDDQPMISTSWNNDTSTCVGALYSLQYTIYYNTSGLITKASAKIKYKNVIFAAPPKSNSVFFVRQSFAVSFLPEVTSGDEEIVVVRGKSGNPGYIMQSVVLAATKINSNASVIPTKAFHFSNNGFRIMDNGRAGMCESASGLGTPVTFGEDTVVGCVLSLSREELKDLCTQSKHPLLHKQTIQQTSFFIPVWLRRNFDFIGIFGNADTADVKQWLTIYSPLEDSNLTSVVERSWSDLYSTCDGMVTEVHYKFLWSHVGNLNNPQAKIISAYVQYEQSIPMQYVGAAVYEKISFPFETTVTWIYDQSAKKISKKKPPKLL